MRAWIVGGRPVHHIIDPATGEPARSCWRTVSVAAGTCTDANIASTAAIIRGAAAPDWLHDLGLPARLVRHDGTVETTAGWPRRRRPGGGRMTGGAPGAIVVTSSTPLWYTTRATGLVALVLLTASMALGLLSSVRFQRPAWPRFVTLGLHRNVSLLALAFTVVHVLTTVLDSFVSIPLQTPSSRSSASYRPLWLGLGAIAFDLMLALAVTSLLRTRMGLRTWRLVHWTAYLCWPVAVLHGLGTGTDTPVRWVLALTAVCVLAVAGLTLWRLGAELAGPAGGQHRGRCPRRAGADRRRCLAARPVRCRPAGAPGPARTPRSRASPAGAAGSRR